MDTPLTQQDEQINIADVMSDLASVLEIEEMPAEEQAELIDMMGETIIQNALARFMDTQDDAVVADVTATMQDMEFPEFLAALDQKYPDFGYIMNDEMRLFLKQLDEMEESAE